MPKTLKNKSRTSSQKRKAALKWWYILPVIAIVAVAGYFVVRYSFASISGVNVFPKNFGGLNRQWPSVAGGYKAVDFDIIPEKEGSPDSYFFANQFSYIKSGGYVGIQNKSDEPGGKIALFSIWNAIDAKGPGYVGDFSGEGVGKSVRIKYPWQTGKTYRFSVVKAGTDATGTWWDAKVTDLSSGGESKVIGSIKTPIAFGDITNQNFAFHERFYGDSLNCGEMYQSAVTFVGARASSSDPNAITSALTFVDPIKTVVDKASACSSNHYITKTSKGYYSSIGTKVPGGVALANSIQCRADKCWYSAVFDEVSRNSVVDGYWVASKDRDRMFKVNVYSNQIRSNMRYCFTSKGKGLVEMWINEGGVNSKESARFNISDKENGGCMAVQASKANMRNLYFKAVYGDDIKINAIKSRLDR